jgi:hypothetical protein
MEYDYYVDKYLIIEFISVDSRLCKITTDLIRKYKYFKHLYDKDTLNKKQEKINKKKNQKIIFENGYWVKNTYKKKYEKKLKREFGKMNKLIKIYKENIAFIE